MKKAKYILPVLILLLAMAGIYLLFVLLSKNSPYPSLKEQRAALADNIPVNPVRLLDSTAIMGDLKYLSSDSCAGRAPETPGHANAVERIVSRMKEAGLDSFKSMIHSFWRLYKGNYLTGKNIIGWIKGTRYPDQYIVISAHYDHLGVIGDSTYYGASDNASGTACILAMASYFNKNQPAYSLIFAAFDMDETGLRGSYQFINHLPSPLRIENIKFNLNVDMIVRNDSNEIFACGIYHYPSLRYLIDEVRNKTNSKILMGHDTGYGREDWTMLSDHYPFHIKKIPFLYFGTEDHIDYHRPTDTWQKIDPSTYIENCNMLAMALSIINASLDSLKPE